MCGINGYVQFEKSLKPGEIEGLINLMNDKIIHRGPDEDGVFACDSLGLGMRRLSIIDISTGKQPIYNEDKSLVIVLNGEVYNYKALREDLLKKGHIFTTTSDTETVLHCFEEYGVGCLDKLNGMYAFAIYDFKNQKVTVARDRIGEKPLYYYSDGEKLLFASELKSIIASGMVEKKICKEALCQYLQLTYIPAPLTILENVYKLCPGNYMEIDINGGFEIKTYWNVTYSEKTLITDYEECKRELRKAMFNAVEECMVSDVPVGAFLSGGIDSTTIVGIMSKISSKPIDTFTIGYKEKQYDESDRAKLTSELHKTNHHIFTLDYNDALPELEKLVGNIDEPFADSSLIPTYMVSKFARQHVKTILTGDSGDELFGGYEKYLIGYYAGKFNKIPSFMQKGIKKVVYAMPPQNTLARRARKVIDTSQMDIFEQRRNLMCLAFKNVELPKLLSEEYNLTGTTDFIRSYYDTYANDIDEMSCALYTDLKVVLEGDMLPKVDRASMLNSLETRVPMLHREVVELAARIPIKYKINSQNKKIILKETFSDIIPPALLTASKKGFAVPIAFWFKNELKAELIKCLDEEKIRSQGIFNYDYIAQIMEEHFTDKRDRTPELWSLYVFEKWYENYFV